MNHFFIYDPETKWQFIVMEEAQFTKTKESAR